MVNSQLHHASFLAERNARNERDGMADAWLQEARHFSKVIGGAGKILGAAGLVLTAADMYQNGVNTSNAIDMAMGAASFIPIYGWVIGGVYFIGNEALKYSTGRDIGQHIDNLVK